MRNNSRRISKNASMVSNTQVHSLLSRPLVATSNPALRIERIGIIGLPLSVRDAQAIAGVCKQAPFGKGDETVVDESVKKTWELNVDEFTCCNPVWQGYLEQLSKQGIQDLGVEVAASAQPYKLLLYEEGAFFKAHRDGDVVTEVCTTNQLSRSSSITPT